MTWSQSSSVSLWNIRSPGDAGVADVGVQAAHGVGRTLDAKLDMWTTAEPVVREWIERNLGPAGRLEDVAEGAGEIGRFAAQVPSLLTRAATLLDQVDDITRNGLVLSPDTVEAIGRAEQRRNHWTAVALWAIAALLAVVAWRLF